MKYRKKPVVVEAVQFDGTNESCDWLLPQLESGEIGRSFNKLHIKTLEGVMEANLGDYIIKGVNGEFYPCKPDIFAKTYEPVDEAQDKKIRNAIDAIQSNYPPEHYSMLREGLDLAIKLLKEQLPAESEEK